MVTVVDQEYRIEKRLSWVMPGIPSYKSEKKEARKSLENVGEALGTSEKPRTNDDAEDDDNNGRSVYECCRV